MWMVGFRCLAECNDYYLNFLNAFFMRPSLKELPSFTINKDEALFVFLLL